MGAGASPRPSLWVHTGKCQWSPAWPLCVPLPLFPDWAQPFLSILPFRALVDVPFRLYTGDIPAGEAFLPVALSLAWAVLLVALGRRLLSRGTRALVVQGG